MDFELACYRGDLVAAKAALDRGESITFLCLLHAVNTRDKPTAKKKLPLCQLLLQHGANPNMSPAEGYSWILDVAAASFSPEILRLVLEAGADVTVGYPIHSAVSGNRDQNIPILLAAGADPNKVFGPDNPDSGGRLLGMTALEYAKHLRHRKCAEQLK